jgi:hypothetical protein
MNGSKFLKKRTTVPAIISKRSGSNNLGKYNHEVAAAKEWEAIRAYYVGANLRLQRTLPESYNDDVGNNEDRTASGPEDPLRAQSHSSDNIPQADPPELTELLQDARKRHGRIFDKYFGESRVGSFVRRIKGGPPRLTDYEERKENWDTITPAVRRAFQAGLDGLDLETIVSRNGLV